MIRMTPELRDRYGYFHTITTRWMDNDAYGHLNNTVYYSYFDTLVNQFLIDRGALDIVRSPVTGLVVETACQYFSTVAFPDRVQGGLRVGKLGRTRNDEAAAAAQGHFVHVYVDRITRRPTPLPQELFVALKPLLQP
jgi:acyl-CoA thioester hydrolase